jgi:hypothetical protein
MEAPKSSPDQPILTVLGDARKVEEMIKGRIEPTTLSKLLQFVGSGGTKPSIGSMINLNQFAKEMIELSYTEIENLTKYGQALPKPITYEGMLRVPAKVISYGFRVNGIQSFIKFTGPGQ